MVEQSHETHISDPVLDGSHPEANASKKHGHERVEGKRTKDGTDGKVQDGKLGGDWHFSKNPQFLKDRVAYFDGLLKAQQEQFAGLPV